MDKPPFLSHTFLHSPTTNLIVTYRENRHFLQKTWAGPTPAKCREGRLISELPRETV